MNNINTKKLIERFEFLTPQKPSKTNLMAFGFNCDDGWFDIIWRLCENIEKLIPGIILTSEEQFEVLEVDEKHGILEFYVSIPTKEIIKQIEKAKEESKSVCEICGSPGKTISISKNWLKTLCEDCL